MPVKDFEFTSECVTMGHPDKIADQISDAVLDEIYRCDPKARVACETLVTKDLVFIAGEVTTHCWVDMNKIIRKTVKDIGYIYDEDGFYYKSLAVINTLHEQSPDIAAGVVADDPEFTNAGDQGMMFGYASNETPALMPLPITLARNLCNRLAEVRSNGLLEWLRPDGKSQVAVEYRNGKPYRIKEVLISTQHSDKVDNDTIRDGLTNEVLLKVIPNELLIDFNPAEHFLVNPTGRFVKGGPGADTGLTGRKIIVDTYGGMGRHGGGAFSGKDPSKVDRSGAYMARYIAKNIVAAGIADKLEVELAYAIGLPDPRSIFVESFGTAKVAEADIVKMIWELFQLSVGRILLHFDLLRPIYLNTARYGHFGIEGYPWEKTDKVEDIRNYFNL